MSRMPAATVICVPGRHRAEFRRQVPAAVTATTRPRGPGAAAASAAVVALAGPTARRCHRCRRSPPESGCPRPLEPGGEPGRHGKLKQQPCRAAARSRGSAPLRRSLAPRSGPAAGRAGILRSRAEAPWTAEATATGRRRTNGWKRWTTSSRPAAKSAPASCSVSWPIVPSAAEFRSRRRSARTSTRSPGSSSRPIPATAALERRIKSIIRWNAMAMVVRANKHEDGIGGHISTYASAATLLEVGFNHFFRGRGEQGFDGDLIYFQGHASPGIYARAFLEGRLSEAQLENFRRELAPGGGLSSYPHPWLMPDFWEFPTVSMGLGPISAIYQARFNRYLEDRGLVAHRPSPGLGLPRRRRDRRARVARRADARLPRGARQPHLRRQLQPPAARRPGARQRQDHPGARSGLPRRRLERHQGDLGLVLGSAPRPRQGRLAGAA